MSKALEALLDYRQLDAAGVVVKASRQAIHEVADEVARLEDRVATFLLETEDLWEVIIAKHGQIERLEARNARLLEALSLFASKRACECMQFIGKHLVFGAGKKCDYCNAREAIATEEKEQSK